MDITLQVGDVKGAQIVAKDHDGQLMVFPAGTVQQWSFVPGEPGGVASFTAGVTLDRVTVKALGAGTVHLKCVSSPPGEPPLTCVSTVTVGSPPPVPGTLTSTEIVYEDVVVAAPKAAAEPQKPLDFKLKDYSKDSTK